MQSPLKSMDGLTDHAVVSNGPKGHRLIFSPQGDCALLTVRKTVELLVVKLL